MVTKQINIKYDPIADAAYIYLKEIGPGESKKTIPLGPHDDLPFELFALDFDSDERLLGIEILNASRHFPETLMTELRTS